MAAPHFGHYSLAILVILCSVSPIVGQTCDPVCKASQPFFCNNTATFNRSKFNQTFLFGTATSAYQIEGAAHRAFNSWDYYTHRYPEKTPDQSNADTATRSFELFMEDVKMMKKMNVDAYRFSIAWSRVLPKGRLSGGVDEAGISYYNSLINALKANGIEPFVTIFHWDVPQTLEDEYGGFLSRNIVKDYRDYAELLFQRFGDRVKNWITLNQPYTLATKGYGLGNNAPGRCTTCEFGDSGIEPYVVAHNELLAHAEAVALYRRKYQRFQNGRIGTTLIGRWFVPLNETSADDVAAKQRALDFIFGWFMDPLTTGDYPKSMKKLVGNRLPQFSKKESSMLKGSLDFLGLNYYITQYVSATPDPDPNNPDVSTDIRVNLSFERDGKPIGQPGFKHVYYPRGFRELLTYIKNKYNNPLIYITENGYQANGQLPVEEVINDQERIEYQCSHLSCLKCAIENGSNVKGYFVWSLLDNYEFGQGYTVRFGLNYVDFNNATDRRPKKSATWYTEFLKKN